MAPMSLFALVCFICLFGVVRAQRSEDNVENRARELDDMKDAVEVDNLKSATRARRASQERNVGGVTYVRWGRTTCKGDARVVYRGHAAGPKFDGPGSGANYLCLHERPQWKKYLNGFSTWAGQVYGVEYEMYDDRNVFSRRNHHGRSFADFPAPCVVCYVPNRFTVLMIPARTECPRGWTKEYYGYLTSEAAYGKLMRTEYVCLDEAPETASGGFSENEAMFFPVEARCGSLPCSKFINGWELTCVVCTK